MREFLSMGGYGAYVWSAYGFTALVLGGLFLQSLFHARSREEELAELRRRASESGTPKARRLEPRRMKPVTDQQTEA